ncbi:MAG: hypothetical protein EOP51_09180 [Sphingobacteriales bacterium]|nr:MAG: hypothetical protein EOP51_09180 [Sphingobacteriales bacterium]
MKKTRRILIAIALVILIGVTIGYMVWNKPTDKAEDHKGVAVSTTTLCNAYAQNEDSANAQYLSKVLQVAGVVEEVSKSQDGAVVITLKGNDDMAVQCTMRDANAFATKGATATVKGFCSGSTMFDILLTDCIVVNN